MDIDFNEENYTFEDDIALLKKLYKIYFELSYIIKDENTASLFKETRDNLKRVLIACGIEI